MSWGERATDRQVGSLLNLFKWEMPNAMIPAAIKFMEKKSRREMSEEIGRVRDLVINHKLNRNNMLDSKFWDGFLETLEPGGED